MTYHNGSSVTPARQEFWAAQERKTKRRADTSQVPSPTLQPEWRNAQYLLELVEVVDGRNEPVAAVELPYVADYKKVSPNALVRSFTNAGVYAEHQGFAQHGYTITGRSGHTYDDLVSFYHVRNFVEKYAAYQKEHKNALVRRRDYRLIFTATFESDRYECDVIMFNLQRTTGQTTASFAYVMTLISNGPPDRVWSKRGYPIAALAKGWNEGSTRDPFSRAAPTSSWQGEQFPADPAFRMSELRLSANSIDARKARIASKLGGGDVTGSLNNLDGKDVGKGSLVNHLSTVDSPKAWQAWYESKLFAWKGMTDSLGYYNAKLQLVTSAISEVYSIFASIPTSGEAAWVLVQQRTGCLVLLSWLNTGAMLLKALIGAAGGKVTNDGWSHNISTAGGSVVRGQPVRRYVVRQEASAADIAQSVLGSRGRWREIVNLNGFTDPRTLGSGASLGPGTVVVVPDDVEDVPLDSLGSDLKMQNGDLVVAGNDLGVVRGVANVTQNINHRVTTPRGNNRVFRGFGLRPLRDYSARTFGALFPIDVRDQLLRDHRVESLQNVSAGSSGAAARVSAGVRLVTGGTVSVSTTVGG